MPPNLLNSLFTHRPRQNRTPKENFLTEAFAHILRANPDVCRAWLSVLTGESLDALYGSPDVKTQDSFPSPDGKSWSFIDLVVRCNLVNGGELVILSEHKWDSPTDSAQLQRYGAIADATPNATLIFIAPTERQVADAQVGNGKIKAFYWHEIHEFLQKIGAEGVHEFIEFLVHQGLGPAQPGLGGCATHLITERCVGYGTAWNWPTGATSTCSPITYTSSPCPPVEATGGKKGRRGRSRRACMA